MHVIWTAPFTPTVPDQRATGPTALCAVICDYIVWSPISWVFICVFMASALGGLCSDSLASDSVPLESFYASELNYSCMNHGYIHKHAPLSLARNCSLPLLHFSRSLTALFIRRLSVPDLTLIVDINQWISCERETAYICLTHRSFPWT